MIRRSILILCTLVCVASALRWAWCIVRESVDSYMLDISPYSAERVRVTRWEAYFAGSGLDADLLIWPLVKGDSSRLRFLLVSDCVVLACEREVDPSSRKQAGGVVTFGRFRAVAKIIEPRFICLAGCDPDNLPDLPHWVDTYRVGIEFPIWILAMLTGAWPVVAFFYHPYRRHRRRKRGLCLACGYNLTGNTSGVCPECGESKCREPLGAEN